MLEKSPLVQGCLVVLSQDIPLLPLSMPQIGPFLFLCLPLFIPSTLHTQPHLPQGQHSRYLKALPDTFSSVPSRL